MKNASPLPRVVLKFGGTSVSSAGRWRLIASVVERQLARRRRVVVVCSAVAGVTDHLHRLVEAVAAGADAAPHLDALDAAHDRLAAALGLDAAAALEAERTALRAFAGRTAGPVPPPVRAGVMACGELMSTRLGAAWLHRRGLPVAWADARTLLRARPPGPDTHEDERWLSACCAYAPDRAVQARVDALGAEAVVTQGFIAGDADGRTVLLGRGGSDTSGAYLAALLEAEEYQIWTDVPGVFTTDPRAHAHARLLRTVTCHEAEVLGSLGGSVLHPRALQPVREQSIPLRIGWTHRPEVRGTLITDAHGPARAGVRAVTSRRDLVVVAMARDPEWQPVGFMAEVADVFRRHGLSMDLIASSPSEIRATVDLAAFPGAAARLDGLLDDLRGLCDPCLHGRVACVSVVGSGLSRELGRLGPALALLEASPVHLVSHAANDSHVSWIVDEDAAPGLVAALHDALIAGGDGDPILGPRWIDLQDPAAPAPRRRPPATPRAAGA